MIKTDQKNLHTSIHIIKHTHIIFQFCNSLDSTLITMQFSEYIEDSTGSQSKASFTTRCKEFSVDGLQCITKVAVCHNGWFLRASYPECLKDCIHLCGKNRGL